jgi:hypothetical protein
MQRHFRNIQGVSNQAQDFSGLTCIVHLEYDLGHALEDDGQLHCGLQTNQSEKGDFG